MEKEVLRQQMMNLWERTFHDSDDYIKLVFDNYFNTDLIAYEERVGRVVSSLLGVPYQFSINNISLKGLYLCGLATDESYRRHGLMSKLIDEIILKASDLGYDFVFLIPANKGIIRYYRDRGFSDSIFRVQNRYVGNHDFKREFINSFAKIKSGENLNKNCEYNKDFEDIKDINDINNNDISELNDEGVSREIFKKYNVFRLDLSDNKIISKVAEYVRKNEVNNDFITLVHSVDDITIAIKENYISSGAIGVVIDEKEIIKGVVFVADVKEEELRIPYIIYDDGAVRATLLQWVADEFRPKGISVYSFPEEVHRSGLVGNFYAADFPGDRVEEVLRPVSASELVEIYGMIRLLNPRNILKMLAATPSFVENRILVEFDESNNLCKICTNVGNYIVSLQDSLKSDSEKAKIRANGDIELSWQQLAEILFRHPSDSKIVSKSLGLPRIPINMALLLD